MKQIINQVLKGKHNKPILLDYFYKEDKKQKPIVVFCHGYKGFKDWGAWNLMAEAFANAGFFFAKFNFSHNGGTVEQPIDFPDLEAFGNNNYTKELDDVASVLDFITSDESISEETNTNNITLIGHSRGGGIVLIKAEEDSRIKSVITLAGVSNYGNRSATIGDLEQWKKDGVKYVKNGRTKQKMPHYYQFYLDFKQNEKRFTIQRAVQNLKVPHLIIHGDKDTSIQVSEAEIQHQWNPKSKLKIIKNSDHVFNTKHPWDSDQLSSALKEVVTSCVTFLS